MQEFIVYRNPLEAAMWRGLSDGSFFPIICGIIVFFVVFLISNQILTGGRSYRTPAWKTYLALAVGAISAISTIWGMWL